MRRGGGSANDDDREVLVDNEQPTATLDNDFGGDQDEDGGGFVATDQSFAPAQPPLHSERNNDDFRTVDLHNAHLLIAEPPPDRYNYSYLVFYLLGTATMTPWNFFVTAEDYWLYKFRNTTLNSTEDVPPELTPMQKGFTCDLTLTAAVSGTTALILNAIYGQRVSLKLKMLGTLSLILLIFGVTIGFVEVNTDSWQEQFFLITLFTVVIANVCSAVMSGGVFGIAGLFPSEYMTAMVSGQALGGIFTALAFIMVLAFDAGPNTTAFVFFIVGALLTLLSIVCYATMSKLKFFKYYVEGGNKCQIVCTTPLNSVTVDSGVALEPNTREVFSKIYVEAVTICVLFATTLSVYPGVTVLMQSEDYGNNKPWNDVYFLPVVNYLFFNSGDYLGRILAGAWERPRKNVHTVLLMTILRVLYVPFFLCSNTNLHNYLPTLVQTDAAFISMIITFAITNGYLANIVLIMAPRAVQQHEREVASAIMVASLSCGLALGSMLSMIFVQLL